MRKYFFQHLLLFVLSGFATSVIAQQVEEPKATNPEWSKPFKPFRIAGNLYYVGTYDLACYLITTKEGNILINTGLAASAAQIKSNIEALGFAYKDIRVLLTGQAHYDHVGAMAEIKAATGAKLMVDEQDASVLADGGRSDYAFGRAVPLFKPVKPDSLLHDKDVIQLGDMQITMLHLPGHTKGSAGFLFTVKDSSRSYKIFIANMPTIVIDKKFADVTEYRAIQADYAYTLNAMKNVSFDIWLAAHASQFNLHEKHKEGGSYNPAAFFDQEGYNSALAELQSDYDEKVKNDAH